MIFVFISFQSLEGRSVFWERWRGESSEIGWLKARLSDSHYRSFVWGAVSCLFNTGRGVVFITVGGPHNAVVKCGEEDR